MATTAATDGWPPVTSPVGVPPSPSARSGPRAGSAAGARPDRRPLRRGGRLGQPGARRPGDRRRVRQRVPWLDGRRGDRRRRARAHRCSPSTSPAASKPPPAQVQGPAVTAHRTVALHSLKPGHLLGDGPDRCGEIEVADIGLGGGDPLFVVCDEADAPRPARQRTAHKWSAGSVLVVGGSPGFSGAPLLAATAAQRFGAGLVTVLSPGGGPPPRRRPALRGHQPRDRLRRPLRPLRRRRGAAGRHRVST